MKKVIISSYYLGDDLFSKADNPDKEDLLIPVYELRNQLHKYGYELVTPANQDPEAAIAIIFTEAVPQPGAKNYPFFQECKAKGLQNKLWLQLIESPLVTPHSWKQEAHQDFAKVYTWNDDLVDNNKYFKMAYYQPKIETTIAIPFQQRKLCAIISSNKMHYHQLELYSERIEAIRALERVCPYQFDLYGSGWNRPRRTTQIEQMYPFLVSYFPSYRGTVSSKLDTLAKYKFSICYENMIGVPGYSGYITEKIFHCLMAGCVPVYLGANNITNYIPPEVFIDRRKFFSYEQMIAFLLNISEKEYARYLNNIMDYLDSEMFYNHFSVAAFVKLILEALERA